MTPLPTHLHLPPPLSFTPRLPAQSKNGAAPRSALACIPSSIEHGPCFDDTLPLPHHGATQPLPSGSDGIRYDPALLRKLEAEAKSALLAEFESRLEQGKTEAETDDLFSSKSLFRIVNNLEVRPGLPRSHVPRGCGTLIKPPASAPVSRHGIPRQPFSPAYRQEHPHSL